MRFRPKNGAPEAWHKLHVSQDEEFLRWVKVMPARKGRSYTKDELYYHGGVGSLFGVLPYFIDHVREGNAQNPTVNKVWYSLAWQKEFSLDEIVIKFDPTITRRQFVALWDDIVALRKENGVNINSKYKPPEDTELLYAVCIARNKGMSFASIYKKYRSGDLEKYNRAASVRFDTQKKLENYFSRYYEEATPDIIEI